MQEEFAVDPVTVRQALDALEADLRRQMKWWDEAHGHTEVFRLGTCNGLSTAIARIIFLREQAAPEE